MARERSRDISGSPDDYIRSDIKAESRPVALSQRLEREDSDLSQLADLLPVTGNALVELLDFEREQEREPPAAASFDSGPKGLEERRVDPIPARVRKPRVVFDCAA